MVTNKSARITGLKKLVSAKDANIATVEKATLSLNRSFELVTSGYDTLHSELYSTNAVMSTAEGAIRNFADSVCIWYSSLIRVQSVIYVHRSWSSTHHTNGRTFRSRHRLPELKAYQEKVSVG